MSDETLAAGATGMALNADGDSDLTYATSQAYVELQGGGGRNVLTAQGGFGTGAAFAGKTRIIAGALGDEVHGGNGDDGGSDTLNAGEGNDAIVGGAGADRLSGGDGNDLLDSVDGVADILIDGGAGADTAYFDRLADPAPVAVETLFPR